MTTSPLIVDSYPANNAVGIPIADQIKVTFNQEMDLSSINTGTFIVIGKDEAPIFGPVDVTPLDDPGFEDEDILSSPYVGAYVKGTVHHVKVNASGAILEDDSILDEDGNGTLWYTMAVFIPDTSLAPNSNYSVLLLGDENIEDDLDTGVRTRTVFDPKSVSVTGTGTMSFSGGYSADETRTYIVKITTPGATGVAEYEWWNEAAPLDVYQGRTTTGERELQDGVILTCSHDGDFALNDTFSVLVKPYVLLESNYKWSFTTGSGSIATPPSSSSASGVEDLDTAGLAGGLEIVSVTPDYRETNLDPSTITEIVIVFNKDLDATTITQETVKVWTESVNGDPQFPAEGNIPRILSVEGNTLTIQIVSD
jgi:hypothetical protein